MNFKACRMAAWALLVSTGLVGTGSLFFVAVPFDELKSLFD